MQRVHLLQRDHIQCPVVDHGAGFDKSITEFPQSVGGVSVNIFYSSTITCSPDVYFNDGVPDQPNSPYDGLLMGGGISVVDFFIGTVYPGANDV
ncbi:hypothetical protein [Nonomuraea typhae]|uniref:Uncharacterized protein n=1 Tax=Nonomuraea typhae TaxID=2603600 RepID=A0ABW7YX86_9ACTN